MSSLTDSNGVAETSRGSTDAGCGTDRLIRLPEVMDRVGLKRTAIYQRMREGRFPKSRSLGPRCTVWLEAEVNEWVRNVCEVRPE